MSELKQQRRVQVAANWQGDPGEPSHVRLVDHKDGGEYGLHVLGAGDPTTGEARVLLPSAGGPHYPLELRGSADAFKRLGNLFHQLARRASGESGGDDPVE